ncbi:MAG: flippase-like domain-containing protein [Rhodospirillaceae bacterium]|nr:flippase-like domain-containing protein [Rhodospirillaceae bacterium]
MASSPPISIKKWLLKGGQLLVTLACFVWLYQKMDVASLQQHWHDLRWEWLGAAVASFWLLLAVSAWRWKILIAGLVDHHARLADDHLSNECQPNSPPLDQAPPPRQPKPDLQPQPNIPPLRRLYAYYQVGAFFNQVLPGSVSGDFVRAFYLRPITRGLTLSLSVVLVERLLGLGVLLAMAGVAALLLAKSLGDLPFIGLLLAGMSLGYLAGCWVVARLPLPHLRFQGWQEIRRKLLGARGALTKTLTNPPLLGRIMLLSLLVQLLFISGLWLNANALGIGGLNAVALLVIWPVTNVLLMVPISLAGWGVRESLLVLYFGYQGMAAESALALSLLCGVSTLLASLPGGLIWWRLPLPGRLPAQ